jgi:transcriptional regulator with XRE-family HTH domain
MADQLKRNLGAGVRAARRRAGLTQEALGQAIGKTPESISNIERGKQLPMIDTLAAMSAALGVPLSELFDLADQPYRTASRTADEAKLRELARGLSDDMLALAVQQIEVLAKGSRGAGRT